MKKIILLLALFFAGITFAQNQSDGAVQSSITTPIPQQFFGGEIFRFSKGLVTQLDNGSAFDFTSSRWFSIGRLKTGSQIVYGLRFQLPKRGVTFGYQDVNDDNPRIQWIGDNVKSNLEFRSATSSTSTISTLNATMTFEGRTYFGTPLISNEPLVGIDYSTVPGSTKTGLIVENNTDNGKIFTGIKTINRQKGELKTGISVLETGKSELARGIDVTVKEEAGLSKGVKVVVVGSQVGSTYGVESSIESVVSNPTGFGAAIYGSSASLTNRFAGYFNGDVFVTGTFTVSDKKLKENIQPEENVLEKLSQLETVTYTFKNNDHLNLPSQLQHGFLAQNLEEVFPELVTTINKPIYDEKEGTKQIGTYDYKAVNYTGLISVLASSLQELNEQSKETIQQIREEAALDMQQMKEEFNEKIEALEAQIATLTGQNPSTKETLNTQNNGDLGFSMEQNKPNPFANQTVINYTLPGNTKATISVVDLSGKFIKEYNLSNQKGQLTINASEIGKGIFVYALISNDEVIMTRKMIVR